MDARDGDAGDDGGQVDVDDAAVQAANDLALYDPATLPLPPTGPHGSNGSGPAAAPGT